MFSLCVICMLGQIPPNGILDSVSKCMFNLNKIQGHIKMLEFEQLKLTRYADEATRMEPRNLKREADIQRALRRVEGNIILWRNKLAAITDAPPRAPDRPAIGDGPDRPLIG